MIIWRRDRCVFVSSRSTSCISWRYRQHRRPSAFRPCFTRHLVVESP